MRNRVTAAQARAAGLLPEREDDVQRRVVDGLRELGYRVVVTSRRVKRCHQCGAWPRSGTGDGVDKGLADVLARHPSWPRGLFVAVEIKRAAGRWRWSSPEQKAAFEAGDFYLARSLEDAVAFLAASRQG
jgi:hypothetical protein